MALLKFALAALAVCAPQSAVSSPTARSEGLHLIKTSVSDHGTWLTKAQRHDLIKSGTGFIDITNTKDKETIESRSGKPVISARSDPKYPDSLSHVEEAKALIGTVDMKHPHDWLEHLTS